MREFVGSWSDSRSGWFFPATCYVALHCLSCSMFSSLSFKHALSHNRNSMEDEVTVLHIAAA